MGDRPYIYRLWPPIEQSHNSDVEGVPNYPDSSRFWQACDKHQVNILYSSHGLARMMRGCAPLNQPASIRLLGSVGEPINPETWLWYYNVVGDGDACGTWWQTETDGALITPLPAQRH